MGDIRGEDEKEDNIKLSEALITHFAFMRHGSHRKQKKIMGSHIHTDK
jgi:hypothetical protein